MLYVIGLICFPQIPDKIVMGDKTTDEDGFETHVDPGPVADETPLDSSVGGLAMLDSSKVRA